MDANKVRRLKQLYTLSKADYSLDDITFNDLNLNEVFEAINRTSTSVGEEVLYSMLRMPLTAIEDLNDRKSRIRYFIEHEDEIYSIRKGLNNVPRLTNISVFEYLSKLEDVPAISYFRIYRAIILSIISILLLFINAPVAVIAIILVFFYNSISYFKLRDSIKPYFICISYLSKAIKAGLNVSLIDKSEYKDIAFIKNSSIILGNISGETIHGGSGNPFDVFINIIKMGLHLDIICFYALVKRINNNKCKCHDFLYNLGAIDALASVALLMKDNENICVPEYSDNGRALEVKEIIHPLVDNAVGNNLRITGSILLTGSNASGKSTFLRCVGINIVLAQSLCIAFAKDYKGSLFKIISSMSITDSVESGDSFYMAEIKSLKRIIDILDDNDNYICFVDEVLKGTNTKERIAASFKILEYFDTKCICMAATHDMELTQLLDKKYTNMHFSEDVDKKDVVFSYIIKEGPANTTNAIRLLETLDFPTEITGEAYSFLQSYF